MKTLAYVFRRDGHYDNYPYTAKAAGIWLACHRCRLRTKLNSAYTDENETYIFCSEKCVSEHEEKIVK